MRSNRYDDFQDSRDAYDNFRGRASPHTPGREALEREYAELQAEKERGQEALDGLAERIKQLRQEVEVQRRRKPASCASCRAVTLQVDAAAQSLLGSAGHVARTLLRDADADRKELLSTVLRYMEPVKHLDPDLEDLYERAQASLALGSDTRPPPGAGASSSRAGPSNAPRFGEAGGYGGRSPTPPPSLGANRARTPPPGGDRGGYPSTPRSEVNRMR
eukprot:TRINITY_DN122816_c0_g1_i1.p1 TRINITY_DN122816_c0_g1~~TRINITY_DN122816_c0_g1_i1.p1  ORF type:complete len:218 (+),score=50.01 TRINITY_DN122816_c0_g1_i1:161-814(+)